MEDRGGKFFNALVMDMFRWIVEIVLRPLEKKGSVQLPKRGSSVLTAAQMLVKGS